MKKTSIQKQIKRLNRLEARSRRAQKDAIYLASVADKPFFRGVLTGERDYFGPVDSRKRYLEVAEAVREKNETELGELTKLSEQLPGVRGQNWDKRRNFKIGIISDEFLFDSIKEAADFLPISPSNFTSEIPKLDLLLIVTTWRGLEDEWRGLAQKGSPKRRLLENEIIPLAKKCNVKVCFYSKEDPPNFGLFISIAEKCDVIFTSAEEKVNDYRKRVGEDIPVEVLQFGVNFKFHNPLGCMRYKGRELVFAGSWMTHKYPQRTESGAKIFQGIQDAGAKLFLVDRNLDLDPKKFKDLERYMFPSQFLEGLHPPLAHVELMKLQKLLPLAINLNSVFDSQTMYANRVIELLAMGTLILSNYSAGVNTNHPEVAMFDSAIDTRMFLETLSDSYIMYCQVEGIRRAFKDATCFDRVDQILLACGFSPETESHSVYVATDTFEEFCDFQRSQATEISMNWVQTDELDQIIGGNNGDLVIFPNNISFIGPDVVDDIVCAYRYSDVDCVYVEPFDSNAVCYEPGEKAGGINDAHAVWLRSGKRIETSLLRTYLRIKTSCSGTPQPEKSNAEHSELSIIVPVFNNGPHLVHKCIRSIVQSDVYHKSHIILVDDGSTDMKTRGCVDLLDKLHPNVEVFRFEDGGSGSASRPRNKGLELVKTPFVTYLDPDNEQLNNAYDYLLEKIKEDQTNFALGNMIRFKGVRSTVNNARFIKNALAKYPILDGENSDVMKYLNYRPMSIQALVADSAWLRSLGITQPEGAVGQDSYFFQQMMYYANAVSVTTLPVHVYYAEVANSTVNSISKRFFEKYLPLEEARSHWLKEVGLFEHYRENRVLEFFEHWYIQKLRHINQDELNESLSVLSRILNLYYLQDDPRATELLSEFSNRTLSQN